MQSLIALACGMLVYAFAVYRARFSEMNTFLREIEVHEINRQGKPTNTVFALPGPDGRTMKNVKRA